MAGRIAHRIGQRLEVLLTHIDDCLGRVAAVIIMETAEDGRRANLEATLETPSSEVDEILSLAAAGNLKSHDLYQDWLARNFIKMKKILSSIDPERVEIFRRSKKETGEIFEDKLKKVKYLIHDETSGVNFCVAKTFDNHEKHDNVVLNLMRELKSKAEIIDRLVAILEKPHLQFLTGMGLIIFLVLLCLLVWSATYVYNSFNDSGTVAVSAIEQRMQQDVAELRAISSDSKASILDRMVGVTKKLSEIVSVLPGLLLFLSVTLASIRKYLLRESWKHPQLRAFEDGLRNISRSLKE